MTTNLDLYTEVYAERFGPPPERERPRRIRELEEILDIAAGFGSRQQQLARRTLMVEAVSRRRSRNKS